MLDNNHGHDHDKSTEVDNNGNHHHGHGPRWSTLLLALIALASIVSNIYDSHEERSLEFKTLTVNEAAKQREKAQQVVSAIIDMRYVNEQNRLLCKYNPEYPRDEFYKRKLDLELQRDVMRAALMKANYGTDEIFNQQAHDLVAGIFQFDWTIKDLCKKNAPQDGAWLKPQLEAEKIMKQYIIETKKGKI